jgi:DNA-directed RNA polymerase subunit RPC12/RpoP
MIFSCPECGARLRGTQPGAIVACRACSNPVVVPEAAPEMPAEAPAPVPSAAPAWTTRRLWSTAAGVVLILALAHVGLFLLLTMDARAGVAEIEGRHSRAALEAARPPGAAPEPGTAPYTAWSRALELHESAEAWRVHARQVTLLRTGLFLSFLILVGMTAWGVFSLLRRRPRAD